MNPVDPQGKLDDVYECVSQQDGDPNGEFAGLKIVRLLGGDYEPGLRIISHPFEFTADNYGQRVPLRFYPGKRYRIRIEEVPQ